MNGYTEEYKGHLDTVRIRILQLHARLTDDLAQAWAGAAHEAHTEAERSLFQEAMELLDSLSQTAG